MKIIKVTPENINRFNKELKTPNIIAFVKIYSDECGHCKNLEPKWEKLENEMKNEKIEGLLASLSVNDLDDADCDTNTMGVPTLRVYQGGRRIMDYEGKRETKDMKIFFKNLLKKQKGGKRKKKGGDGALNKHIKSLNAASQGSFHGIPAVPNGQMLIYGQFQEDVSVFPSKIACCPFT